MLRAPSLMKWRPHAGWGCIIGRLDWAGASTSRTLRPMPLVGGPQLPLALVGALFPSLWLLECLSARAAGLPPGEVTGEGGQWGGRRPPEPRLRGHAATPSTRWSQGLRSAACAGREGG